MEPEFTEPEDDRRQPDSADGTRTLLSRFERDVRVPRVVPRGVPSVVILLATLLAVALVVGVLVSRDRTVAPPLPEAIDAPVGATTPSTRPGRDDLLVVHVAGAVLHPGVVRVPAGSRIVDALDAAGGPRVDADLDRLNLAAPVADGDRVTVAAVGDPPGVSVTNPSAPSATGEIAPGAPLDLNTATLEQLEALPGIGPTLAAAILAERDRRGGFTSVEELRDVRGIGDARFAQLRDLVVV